MEVFIYFCVFQKFMGTFLSFYKKIFFYMPGSEGWPSDQHVASGRRGSWTRIKTKAIKTCSKSLCFIVEPLKVTYVLSYMPEHITDEALTKQHGQKKNYFYNLWEYLNGGAFCDPPVGGTVAVLNCDNMTWNWYPQRVFTPQAQFDSLSH